MVITESVVEWNGFIMGGTGEPESVESAKSDKYGTSITDEHSLHGEEVSYLSPQTFVPKDTCFGQFSDLGWNL